MELDWTTFFLEIINFLVLVWILKRFLYRPILGIIAERRSRIEKTLADARSLQDEATALKSQYENRLAGWEKEKESAHARLMEEIASTRERLMAELAVALEAEREKKRVLEDRKKQEWLRATEEKGVILGAQFAARLLTRLATPELDGQLYDLLLEEMRQLPAEQARSLAAAASGGGAQIQVTSAHPLSPERRVALTHALHELIGRNLPASFGEDSDLIGGLAISIGPWRLHANLRDELKFFSEVVPYAD